MAQRFRIPLGARILLLVFIVLQLAMMFDLGGAQGSPAVQLASGLTGLVALGWILVAALRHRRG